MDGDVGFDGVEKGLKIPEDSDGGSFGAGDGLGDGVALEGGTIEVASLDGGAAFVGGGEVISVEDRVKNTTEDRERGGEDPDGALDEGIFLGDDGVAEDFGELVDGFVGGVGEVGDRQSVRSGGGVGVELGETLADVGGVDGVEDFGEYG